MNRVVVSSVVIFLVIAALTAGVYYYERYSIIFQNPIEAVPSDAVFIIDAEHPNESLKEFFSGEIEKQLASNPWFEKCSSALHFLDSVFNDESSAGEIWSNRSFVISAHLTKASRYDFLFLTNLPRGWSERNLKKFISEHASIKTDFTKREYEQVNIYEGMLADSLPFTFASNQSVAMFSFSPVLVEQAIRQLKQGGGITHSKTFENIFSAYENKNNVHVYFNYPTLRDFAFSLAEDNQNPFYSLGGLLAQWSGLEVHTSGTGVLFSGNTTTSDSSELLGSLAGNQPKRMSADGIAPLRTAVLVEVAINSEKDFFNQRATAFVYSAADNEKDFTLYKKRYGSTLEPEFKSWASDEIALIITEPVSSFVDNNSYACVRTTKAEDAMSKLLHASQAIEHYSGNKNYSENYRNHAIGNIPLKNIVPMMYGKIFNNISNCYYTSVNNFIVFANQPSALKDLIDENEEGKVMIQDSVFRLAQKKLSLSSNISFYLNPARAANMHGLPSQFSFLNLLGQASGIYAQWENAGKGINTKILFDFSKKQLQEPVLLWSVQMDSLLATTPVVVSDELNQSNIFVQDEKNNLYRIDVFGNVLWKKDWSEKIISEIFVVDFYEDGSRQLLFNTASNLYLINLDGENVGGYPIRLPAQAASGCTLTETGNKNFSIFIPCRNHVLYAYQLNGRPSAEWNYCRTEGAAKEPVLPFKLSSSDYRMVVSEDSGAVTQLDRKGNQLISYRDKFVRAENSEVSFVPSDSTHDVYLITTDTTGKIFILPADVSQPVFNIETGKQFSAQHSFLIADVDGDGKPDEIFLDKNELTVYRTDGSEIFSHLFTEEISPEIFKSKLTGAEENLFVVSASSNKIFMLNRSGTVAKGFPLKGSIHPAVINSTSNKKLLITGSTDFNLEVYEIR